MMRYNVLREERAWIPKLQEVLVADGVVIAPTETVYGLHADAGSDRACERILQIKQRSTTKPLLVVASSIEMVAQCCELREDIQAWVANYWPGALTLILPARTDRICSIARSGGSTIAIRVTSHPVLRKCIDLYGAALVSTSANVSGDSPLQTSREILQTFGDLELGPDLFLDAGDLPPMLPSTIVDCTRVPFQIVRTGSLIPDLPYVS